ncbi:MAG: nucleotidyltransferase [Clostridiales bacterium]|nr:nucleotidyltransferase [Clostridiales bacterium]
MTVCGIIAEYNPFHNGHRYQIQKARALSGADAVAVVMSGNFVQRGEPAICDKYIRTKAALQNGADIVFELPVFFAAASAAYFAAAAVGLLDQSGIVDFLCFGSESGDIAALSAIAEHLSRETADFKSKLNAALKTGLSFPSARQKALGGAFPVPGQPNDILAIEYLKALKAAESRIKPLAIRRKGAGYHAETLPAGGQNPSASAIRKWIQSTPAGLPLLKTAMPETSLALLAEAIENGNAPNTLDRFSHIFRYLMATERRKDILDVNEGLENRMRQFAATDPTISEIAARVKTKRYTHTKIQRAILHTILNISMTDFEKFMNSGGAHYIRVLGFRKEKSAVLAQLKEKAGLPVLLNLKHAKKTLTADGMKMLRHEILTTDIYNLGLDTPRAPDYEYSVPLCII